MAIQKLKFSLSCVYYSGVDYASQARPRFHFGSETADHCVEPVLAAARAKDRAKTGIQILTLIKSMRRGNYRRSTNNNRLIPYVPMTHHRMTAGQARQYRLREAARLRAPWLFHRANRWRYSQYRGG